MQLKFSFLPVLLLFIYSNCFAQNAITIENALPGNPQYEWDTPDGNGIQGFASEFSVNAGESVSFKVDLPGVQTPEAYTIKVYRIGYYQGNGARLIADLGTFSGSAQPAPLYDVPTGMYDCSNWSVSATWSVPANAVSGVYIAKLQSAASSSMLFFIVRNDSGNSAFLFKTSDATWQAYNEYGGNNFYEAETAVPGFSHATKISYNRPIVLRGDKSSFFNAEYPMIRWMERNGYDVSYATDMDMAKDATPFVPNQGTAGTYVHKVLLSVGHDEYWSAEARSKFENARNAGVHLAFFSGNEVYWKVRWENNYKTLVCYKEGTDGEYVCGGNCDPTQTWTGLWRDGCGSSYTATDGCNPEGPLTGQMSWTQSNGWLMVPYDYKDFRFWRNTSIANLTHGQVAEMPYGTLGNEWDPDVVTNTYPDHRITLSNTQQAGYTHYLSLYRHSSGAWVFGAGTMQWSWGLDMNHDLGSSPASLDMQQATANFFKDLGQTAETLQADLVPPLAVNDNSSPISTIVSPAHNSSASGSFITIAGITTEVGGGAVAGVEVSTDGGLTWHKAFGLENWSYSLTTTTAGIITVKVRAWDDMANLETPGNPGSSNCININVNGPFSYSVFTTGQPTLPQTFNASGGALEVGMKFKSSIPGKISGVQYYKHTGSTGSHIGHLWTKEGVLLAQATFTNETASGWQKASFQAPVDIDPNTTYVVSVFSANGSFTVATSFFNSAQVNGYLTGLANGSDGPNGLYIYSATPAFPDQSVASSNYWVDVLFSIGDLTPPQVTGVTPQDNSTAVISTTQVTATFNEQLNPSTVNNSTFHLYAPGNISIPGSLTFNGTVLSFTPTAPLDLNSTYTATLEGGFSGQVIKDLSGNSLVEDFTWVFTTEDYSAPAIITQPTSQYVCNSNQVSFVSYAYGLPAPTVQWEQSTDSGATWSIIQGATSSILNFIADASDNNSKYRAVFSNTEGSLITDEVELFIINEPTATISAVSSVICSGNPYQLQLSSAQGQGPFTLVVNGNTYSNVNVGDVFSEMPSSESLWTTNTTPASPSLPDPNSVELGIRFKAISNGFINGIRFYKGSGNTGVHKGSLWSSSGAQLATATFTNETATGWQELLFSTPVEITANTVYVASYFAPAGFYSRDEDYFINGNYSNGGFLQTNNYSAANPVGVYAYSPVTTFPSNNPGPHNYWVDVIFSYPANFTFNSSLTSITDNGGCNATGNPISVTSATVGADLIPSFITAAGSTTCTNTPVTYTTQVNQTDYIWTVDGTLGVDYTVTDGALEYTSNTVTINWITPGTKTVSVTYSSGECSGSVAAISETTVLDAPLPVITGNHPICQGSTLQLSTGVFTSYMWSTTDTMQSITVSAAGDYIVTVTDSNGCSGVSTISTVIQNPAPEAHISGTVKICSGGTANLTLSFAGTAPWVYAINNGPLTSTTVNPLVISKSPSSTTTYKITSFSDSLCQGFSTDSAIVSILSPLTSTAPTFAAGNESACIGNTAVIYINAVTNATEYNWTAPAGTLINGSTGVVVTTVPYATVTFTSLGSGTSGWSICVTASNICSTTNSRCKFIRGKLSTPTSITGNTVGCSGSTQNYSIPAVTGANSYVWTGTNGITINGNGTSVQATFPASFTSGTICVQAALSCGYLSSSRCLTISSNLGTIGTITGITSLCPGQTGVSYSISTVTGAVSYNWTPPSGVTVVTGQGTNSITVNVATSYNGGSLCVTASSVCGASTAPKCKTLTSQKPGTPGNIVGEKNGVCGQTITYSIPLVTNATSYTWTLPAGASLSGPNGSNTISVAFSGTFTSGSLCVTANNNCMSGNSRCITVNGIPAKPVAVTGPATVCAGSQGINFSTGSVFNATTYTWTVPSGSVIVSGQGTTSITVNMGTTPGNVTVKAGNACGKSGTLTYAVTINCRLAGNADHNSSALKIYPNPVNSVLTLETDNLIPGNYTIEILDLAGRTVYLKEFSVTSSYHLSDINVSNFDSGIYNLRMVSQHAIPRTARFIVSH
jgi:hypothetical protein